MKRPLFFPYLPTLAVVTSFKMAPPLTTEQKIRIVEWFLQTKSIVTVLRRFKNQYTCKEAIPVRILIATMQSGFKSVWLLPLGLSEGQSVQQCSSNSAWTEGEDQGKLCSVHKRNAHVLYRTLYYVFKWLESPKGLISSMSSTTLPICEILILVCYFDTVFI